MNHAADLIFTHIWILIGADGIDIAVSKVPDRNHNYSFVFYLMMLLTQSIKPSVSKTTNSCQMPL